MDYEDVEETENIPEAEYAVKHAAAKSTFLSNELYDFLKFLALIALPAIGAAYFALGDIWNLPYAEQVVGTITIIDTLLGTLLGISASQYQGQIQGKLIGFMDVKQTETGKKYVLNFPGDLDEIDSHDRITFKVRR